VSEDRQAARARDLAEVAARAGQGDQEARLREWARTVEWTGCGPMHWALREIEQLRGQVAGDVLVRTAAGEQTIPRDAISGALAEGVEAKIAAGGLLCELEGRYVAAVNAVLALPADADDTSDAGRWRGRAEALRQACELLRARHGMDSVAYGSDAWRRNHGVYTAEEIAGWRR
jgi:hypothetical protein